MALETYASAADRVPRNAIICRDRCALQDDVAMPCEHLTEKRARFLSAAGFTYPEVGMTELADLPAGYRTLRRRVRSQARSLSQRPAPPPWVGRSSAAPAYG